MSSGLAVNPEHRRRRGGHASDSDSDSYYPTRWSKWEWVEITGRYQRYRLSGPNQYEYDYDPEEKNQQTGLPEESTYPQLPLDPILEGDPTPTYINYTHLPASTVTLNSYSDGLVPESTARSSCEWPSCTMSFPNPHERDRHWKTVHANNADRPYVCLVEGCSASVKSWTKPNKLNWHNKHWHGPYSCDIAKCTRGFPCGFASALDLETHKAQEHVGMASSAVGANSTEKGTESFTKSQKPPSPQTHSLYTPVETPHIKDTICISQRDPASIMIKSNDPSTEYEKFDPNFKVHLARDFKWGRVFKILWAEPAGYGDGHGSGSSISRGRDEEGRKIFQKLRRFVIIKQSQGHCVCLPIYTYGGQGVLKAGVKAEHHTIIYSDAQPFAFSGEREKGLIKEPIQFKPSNPGNRLDRASRLNYAKTYTVEYNVKVYFIGQIHPNSEWQLSADFDMMHTPTVRGRPPMNTQSYDTHGGASSGEGGSKFQLEGDEKSSKDNGKTAMTMKEII